MRIIAIATAVVIISAAAYAQPAPPPAPPGPPGAPPPAQAISLEQRAIAVCQDQRNAASTNHMVAEARLAHILQELETARGELSKLKMLEESRKKAPAQKKDAAPQADE